MESMGKWNQKDAELLSYYNDQPGLWANDVQKKMLEEAKSRLQSGKVNVLELFYNKFLIFLGHDSAAVGYASNALDHTVRYIVISNIYYYFLIVMSLISSIVQIKNRNKSLVIFICLYFIGLTLAQMLVEVHGRYHYSATLSMVVLAAIGILNIYQFKIKKI